MADELKSVTDSSTRQRLLDLWEKCPECRPQLRFGWDDALDLWIIYPSIKIDENVAFALARDAMVRWLAERKTTPKIVFDDDLWGVVVLMPSMDMNLIRGPTLTDALISAVEAVMDADKEKQDEPSRS